jgi:hypothetical protein
MNKYFEKKKTEWVHLTKYKKEDTNLSERFPTEIEKKNIYNFNINLRVRVKPAFLNWMKFVCAHPGNKEFHVLDG